MFRIRRRWRKRSWKWGEFQDRATRSACYGTWCPRRGYRNEWLMMIAGRLTWKASQRNKVNVFADTQSYQVRGWSGVGNEAPEAFTGWQFWPVGLYQATWNSPRSDRLLLEAGVSLTKNGFPFTREEITDLFGFEVAPTDVSILEASTGLRYNAK